MTASKKNNTAKTTEPVEAVTKAVEKTVKSTAKATVEKVAKTSLQQVASAAKAGDDTFKVYENAISFNKDNLEAFVEFNSLFTQGIQTLSQELMSSFQESIEESTSASTKLFSCKNVQDVVSTHNELFEASYTKAMDQSKKITDMSVKLGEDASAPISKRVNAAVETLSKPLAA